MEAKTLQGRHFIQDHYLRKGLPSSHNTNCEKFGQRFVLEVDVRKMKQVKGVFETCLAPGTYTRLGIRRAVNNTQFRY